MLLTLPQPQLFPFPSIPNTFLCLLSPFDSVSLPYTYPSPYSLYLFPNAISSPYPILFPPFPFYLLYKHPRGCL